MNLARKFLSRINESTNNVIEDYYTQEINVIKDNLSKYFKNFDLKYTDVKILLDNLSKESNTSYVNQFGRLNREYEVVFKEKFPPISIQFSISSPSGSEYIESTAKIVDNSLLFKADLKSRSYSAVIEPNSSYTISNSKEIRGDLIVLKTMPKLIKNIATKAESLLIKGQLSDLANNSIRWGKNPEASMRNILL